MLKTLLRAAALFVAFLLPMEACAQGVIQQAGAVTAGQVPVFIGNGQVMGSGGASQGSAVTNPTAPGALPTGLGVVNSGLGYSAFSGYASGAYSTFQWGFDGSGNALISVNHVGAGAAPTLTFNVDGVPYPFPGNLVVPPNSPAGVPPETYGAVCDGVVGSATGTDNSAALQAWLNAGATGVLLGGNGKVCNFKSALSLTNPTGLRFVGAGPYQTVLQYTGASTTTTLLTLGSTGGSITSNIYLQGLKFASTTALTSGFALVLANVQESTLRDLTFDGTNGNGDIWGGLWCNQCADLKMFGGDIHPAGDGLRVNGTVGAGLKAEFLIDGTRIHGHGASSVGIHIAGGFGGFSCTGYTSVDTANVNFLVDTSAANEGNREIFVNPDCIFDSATSDNVQINDSGPGTGGGGTLNLMGWNGAAGRYGINVINWAGGWVTISNGPTVNAISDDVRLSDATANYVFGPERITGAGGWGVNCTVAISTVYAQPGGVVSANTSGNWATNCSPKTTIPGSLTVMGASTFQGVVNGSVTSGLVMNQPGTFQITPQGTVMTLGSGQNGTDDQGGQIKMTNSGSGVPTPNKYMRVDHLGNLSWENSAYLATIATLSDAGSLSLAGSLSTSTPVTVSTATYTVAATDSELICTNAGGCTLTLPAAASFGGRILRVKTTGGGAVTSASANVVPLAGGAAGTAILAVTAGKWADLQSDSTQWVATAGN